ncbi:MAG TPA: response regulator [Acidimicrobiia bacterium]|nr:response regulator [Acidimicrobiia bacterium]
MPQSEVGTIERALAVGDAIVFVYDPDARTFELRGSDIEILALGVDVGADVATKRVTLDALLRRARRDDASALVQGIDAALDRGDPFETVVAFGEHAATTWLAVRGRRDDGGRERAAIVGTMRDVSRFKRLEVEHLELVRTTEAILQTSSDVISIVDRDGVIREIGSAAGRVLGAEPDTLVGGTVFDSPVVHPDDRERIREVYRQLLSGEMEHEESRYRVRTPDDDLRVVEGHRRVLHGPNGDIDGVVVVVTDVTDHVHLENELREARAAAEAVGKTKAELLSRIGHDMRTPLNAVIGFGKLLAGDELGPEQRDNAAQIVQAGETLLELVNEMLGAPRASTNGASGNGASGNGASTNGASTNGDSGESASVRAERPAAPPSEPDQTETATDTCTVLYVEDNASNLRLVERILAGHAEYSLVSATTGRAGLRLARERRPDLVLLDLHLPDINGDVVLERLRSSPEARETPVLMLSADATPAQVDRLRELGATDYMTKPLDIEQFLETVARLCGRLDG